MTDSDEISQAKSPAADDQAGVGSAVAAAHDTVAADGVQARTAARHMRLGWWALLTFLTLGLLLETLHGLKISWYLDVGVETRRLMWTLAHTHGTLLALVNLGFAATLTMTRPWSVGPRRGASICLVLAILLMPTGFFLGGVWIYDGDPGLGVFLVPVGAAAMFVAVLLTACNAGRLAG